MHRQAVVTTNIEKGSYCCFSLHCRLQGFYGESTIYGKSRLLVLHQNPEFPGFIYDDNDLYSVTNTTTPKHWRGWRRGQALVRPLSNAEPMLGWYPWSVERQVRDPNWRLLDQFDPDTTPEMIPLYRGASIAKQQWRHMCSQSEINCHYAANRIQ